MTELVEQITVNIVLRDPTAVDSAESRGHCPRAWIKRYWTTLADVILTGDQKGQAQLLGGLILINWEHTGLQEIPEVTGGDN